MADYAKDVLVDTQWVEDHLDDDSIRIVEVDENPALYAEAHIPGAIGFDWKKDLQDQVKRDFLGPEEFGELFGSRGISNDHTIVLYGDRNNWFAAYTYWYLKYYGHDNVKLVNGPREKWISEGRPTTQRRAELRGADVHRPGGRRRDPRQARRGLRRARQRHPPGRRPLAAGVLRRADRHGRLRAGGRAARRATSPAPPRCRGPRPCRRTARSSRPTTCASSTAQGRARRRPDDRLLPHRRALGPHLVRAARAARPRTTSRTTTAPGPSGATWSTSRSRRTSRRAAGASRSRSDCTIRAVAPQTRWPSTV